VPDPQVLLLQGDLVGRWVAVPPTKIGDGIGVAHPLDPQSNSFGIWRSLG
jgi:predicted enzyme related to lactoylglutathione lyase